MASKKLVLTFAGTNGDVTFSYAYVKDSVTTSNVKSLVNGLITNGSIFANPPVSAKSAKIVTTSEEPFDLSE